MAWNGHAVVRVSESEVTQKIYDRSLYDASVPFFNVVVVVKTVTTVDEHRGNTAYSGLSSSNNLTSRTAHVVAYGRTFHKIFQDVAGSEVTVEGRRANEAGEWRATVTTRTLTPYLFVDGVPTAWSS